MADVENPNLIPMRVEWQIPDDFPTPNATNIVVQHTQHEFIISLFEILPPVLVGTQEEQRQQARDLASLKAKCVARVIIAAGRMPEFLQVMQEGYATFAAGLGKGSSTNV